MNGETGNKNVMEKKARFLRFAPRIIKIGVFFLVAGAVFLGFFCFRKARYASVGFKGSISPYTINLLIVGGILCFGGIIAYYLVKRSLLKDLRAENIYGGTDGESTDNSLLEAYLSSLEPSKETGENSSYCTKRKTKSVVKTVAFTIITIHALVCLTVVFGLILMFDHCAYYAPETYESGDYFYCIANDRAVLLGLTEEGKEKKYLIIPTEINGHKTSVGYSNIYQKRAMERKLEKSGSSFTNGNLKKVFLSTETNINRWGWHSDSVFYHGFTLQAIVFIGKDAYRAKDFYNHESFSTSLVLCQGNNYVSDQELGDGIVRAKGGFAPANVAYKYNYDGAENDGYYFIDDYDGTVIEFVPPSPTRHGYSFVGWYKEEECINLWDFESDVVPPKNAEENVWEYSETVLYAKWLKIS